MRVVLLSTLEQVFKKKIRELEDLAARCAHRSPGSLKYKAIRRHLIEVQATLQMLTSDHRDISEPAVRRNYLDAS